MSFIQWERSWSEDPLDDSWADTTRDNRPRNVPGRRVDPIRGPRDAYLRPMIDSIGIRQRFAFKSQVPMDLCWRCCVLLKSNPGLGLTGVWLKPVLQLELSLFSPLLMCIAGVSALGTLRTYTDNAVAMWSSNLPNACVVLAVTGGRGGADLGVRDKHGGVAAGGQLCR